MERVLITSWILVLSLGLGRLGVAGPNCANENGDVNGDNSIDLSDAVYSLAFTFQGGPSPVPFCVAAGPKADGCAAESGDVNGDGGLDLSDPVYSLAFTFQGGPPPVPICEAACPSGAFPKVMAFRPSNGERYDEAGNGLGPVQPDQDFDSYANVTTKNPTLPQYTHAIEAAYGSSVDTLFHLGWATINKNRLDPAGTALAEDSGFQIYPGHWLLEVGSTITTPVDGTTDPLTVYVSDSSNLQEDRWAMIYGRDAMTGDPDWSQAEHVFITDRGTDAVGDWITVDRESLVAWQSLSLDLCIAPHALTFNVSLKTWLINLSVNSPLDPSGRAGWELYADFVGWLWTQEFGSGVGADGFEFDGGRWVPQQGGNRNRLIDVDNDAVADWGFVPAADSSGVQAWGLGAMLAMEQVRTQYPDILVLVDSSTPETGYREYSSLNGIEIENYPESSSSDGTPFGGFSTAFSHLRSWVDRISNSKSLSYGFTKQLSAAFGCDGVSDPTNNHFRVGLASALLVGMPHPYAPHGNVAEVVYKCFGTYPWDEYRGGTLNDWDWLGEPLGPASQILDDLDSENLLDGTTWTESVATCEAGDPGTLDAVYNFTELPGPTYSHELTVNHVCSYPSVENVVVRTEVLGHATDPANPSSYAFRFDASATNTYGGDPAWSWVNGVPRLVRLGLNLQVGAEFPTRTQEVLVATAGAFETYTVTFLNVPASATIRRVSVQSGEETGTLTLQNPGLQEGSAERWVRYFEGGAVLLNISKTAWTYTLDPSQPDGYRRLDGAQDPSINSGAPGEGPDRNVFTVPPEDALLVVRYGCL